MRSHSIWILMLSVSLMASGSVGAGERDDSQAKGAQALAKKIDQQIREQWARAKVKPVARSGDAEFLRRAYLDIAGRIPLVSEARAFLADKRADKRERLIRHLLKGSGYVQHFTNVWRDILIPEANNNFVVRLQQRGFEAWLKKRVKENIGYDQLARDLITSSLGAKGPQALAAGFSGQESSLAFFSAKEFKPENLAASTARVFLGISVECAQCHNHPFAKWKRDEFWSFAAFYSGIKSQQLMDILVPGGEDAHKKEITIPGTKKVVQATYLDGSKPKWQKKAKSRDTLAEWVASPSNPYFARAAANRLWAHFFGTGLVEPVDEMVGDVSKASHPELLNVLARAFTEHKFDVQFMIQAITATQAYQLTSANPGGSQSDPTLFAAAAIRGLTPEQLFDSVAAATGFRDSGGSGNDLSAILGGNRSARSEFLTRFYSTERATESQTSILQALSLMNGRVVRDVTSLDNSETLTAVIEAPGISTAKRVEALYLATLSRKPLKQEMARMETFISDAVKKAKGESEKKKAYGEAIADVFWALLNSSEFVLNH